MSSSYPTWILERSFGGLGAAVSPEYQSTATSWPDGPSSPMAREACDALARTCNGAAGGNGPSCLVFLVGGAGNGKSKLAADMVSAIHGKRLGERTRFAQRTYEYALETGERLRIINDATIPPSDRHQAPLVRDLGDVLRSGDHLLACINRGVLIGETRNPEENGADEAEQMASVIAGWLLSGEIRDAQTGNWTIVLVDGDKSSAHYVFGEVRKNGEPSAVVHVVYMDGASLLEQWTPPEDQSGDYRAPLPTGSVEVTPVLSDDRHVRRAAFHACVTQAATTLLHTLERDELDPVQANVASLSSGDVASGWCSLLRGAAVISGTHFTYRELWALFVQSVLGPASHDNLGSLRDWVDERIHEVRDQSGEPRLQALLALGRIRTHMLLFDAGDVSKYRETGNLFPWADTENDALRAVRLADPLRSFGPADGRQSTELADTLSEIEEGKLPGQKIAQENSAVASYWSPLDAEIERVIRDEIDPRNEHSSLVKRNWLLGWYGRYMFRLVGVANGWSAHCSVVNEWQKAWIDADRSQRLSYELSEAILDIVAPPSSERGAESFFTFLQARVDAGDSAIERATIGLQRNRFEITARAEGERVELQIEQGRHGEAPPAATALLDFHLLREAMARQNGHGFTDSLMLIEPRIERIRASLVSYQLSQDESRHRFKFSNRGQPVFTR